METLINVRCGRCGKVLVKYNPPFYYGVNEFAWCGTPHEASIHTRHFPETESQRIERILKSYD